MGEVWNSPVIYLILGIAGDSVGVEYAKAGDGFEGALHPGVEQCLPHAPGG